MPFLLRFLAILGAAFSVSFVSWLSRQPGDRAVLLMGAMAWFSGCFIVGLCGDVIDLQRRLKELTKCVDG